MCVCVCVMFNKVDTVLLPHTPGECLSHEDPLLDEGEVDMRTMMMAGGVMEFELLRLPPQSKTVVPWTFQQGGRGRRRGRGRVVCIFASHLFTHVHNV